MTDSRPSQKYDMIFIGTSVICVLEAVYQSLNGKSVLMIDQQKEMGGAWVSLELFGLHDVENAIHYFLPDPFAFDFMRKVLAWEVIRSPRKYRIFPLPMGGCLRMPYDHKLSRVIAGIKEKILLGKKRALPGAIARIVKEVFFNAREPSYYLENGTSEMLKKVETILLASSVEVKYLTPIKAIHIDNYARTVDVSTDKGKFVGNTIYFTHGSRIFNLTGSSGPFQIEEKQHLRPALHLLIRDKSPSSMYEGVFTADPLIKYVHDITRFTREADSLIGKKKLLVLALQRDVKKADELYQLVFEKLIRAGMLGEQAEIEGSYWQDVYLPRLDDSDLEQLKAEFGDQVEFLKTENFTRGIGYHAQKWASKIRFPTG